MRNILFLIILSLLISYSCKKEVIDMENIKLSFHSDTIIEDKNTIHFDTIITSIGFVCKNGGVRVTKSVSKYEVFLI